MNTREKIFHLAIPCRDLDEAHYFYVEGLGCRQARRYDDRITLDFLATKWSAIWHLMRLMKNRKCTRGTLV